MDLVDAGQRAEECVRRSHPFHSFADHAELDEVQAEYADLFVSVVRDLTMSLGHPRFNGDRYGSGFPSWSEAEQLAVWAHGDLAAWIGVFHPRVDDPYELRIGVR